MHLARARSFTTILFLCIISLLIPAGCLNIPSVNQFGQIALALSPKGIYWWAQPGSNDVYVTDADGSFLRRITSTNQRHTFVSWSPSGKKLAYVEYKSKEDRHSLKTFNTSDNIEKRLVETKQGIWWPQLSPDGKTIIYGLDFGEASRLSQVNVNDGSVVPLNEDISVPLFSWSRDGKSIYAVKSITSDSYDFPHAPTFGHLQRFDRDFGNETKLALGLFNSNDRLAFSPDGSDLIFASYLLPMTLPLSSKSPPGVLIRLHLPTNTSTTLIKEKWAVGSPSISPDGTRVLYVSQSGGPGDHSIVLIPVGGGTPKVIDSGREFFFPFWISANKIGYIEDIGGEMSASKGRIWIYSLIDKTKLDLTERLKSYFK
jgi:Tol biopolymer transport system component